MKYMVVNDYLIDNELDKLMKTSPDFIFKRNVKIVDSYDVVFGNSDAINITWKECEQLLNNI